MAVSHSNKQHRSRCISHSEADRACVHEDTQLTFPKINFPRKSVAVPIPPISEETIEKGSYLAKKRFRSQSFTVCFENNLPRSNSPFLLDVSGIVHDEERPPTPAKQNTTSDVDLEKPTQLSRNISLADSLATKSCSVKKMALFRSPIFLAYLARLSIVPKNNVDGSMSNGRLRQLQEDVETHTLEEIRRMLLKADQDLAISRSSSRYASGISTPVPTHIKEKNSLGESSVRQNEKTSKKNAPTVSVSKDEYHSSPMKLSTTANVSNNEIPAKNVDSSINEPKFVGTPRCLSRVQSFIINRDLNAIAPSSY